MSRDQSFFVLIGQNHRYHNPNLNMGPPKISETRMLKLKTQLDIVKYSLYVKKNFSARGRPGGVKELES